MAGVVRTSNFEFPNHTGNVLNQYRVTDTTRAYSISPQFFTFESGLGVLTASFAAGAGAVGCVEVVSSSFYQNDYDIDAPSTALYQYQNLSSDPCAFQSPYILGVRGARTLRTNNIPYSIMKSNQNINMNSGTFFGKGSIP